jgi:signal transduction histidine kinase
MPIRFKRSLRFRGGLAFALFGCLLSLLLSGWLYLASHDASLRLMDETLKAELEDYFNRLQRNPNSLPAATVTVVGFVSPSLQGAPPPPEELRKAEPGLSNMSLNGLPYRLLVQDVGGSRYYLLYNKTHQLARELRFRWLLGSGVFVITLLASAGGLWLADRVISPVSVLAGRVKLLEPEATHSPLGQDFPPDELGELARAFDRYLSRLGAFIERERAFTDDVSHELRTPLSIIQGAAEIQEEDASLSARHRARALRVQRAAQEMAEITTALLVLAREQRVGSAPPASVSRVVQEAVERHRHLLEGKSIEVILEIDADLRLPVDRALLLIVISNLIRNAFQHTDQGEISIRLTAGELRIVDTGHGIAETELAHIFQRHYKGSDSRGEGIGLSLTKRICDRYGWDIAVISRRGRGTEVTLDFGTGFDIAA